MEVFLISLESGLGKYILGYEKAIDQKDAQRKVLEKIRTKVPLEKITISCDYNFILVGGVKIIISKINEFVDLHITLF